MTKVMFSVFIMFSSLFICNNTVKHTFSGGSSSLLYRRHNKMDEGPNGGRLYTIILLGIHSVVDQAVYYIEGTTKWTRSPMGGGYIQ